MGAPKAVADTSPPFLLQAQIGGQGVAAGQGLGVIDPCAFFFPLSSHQDRLPDLQKGLHVLF